MSPRIHVSVFLLLTGLFLVFFTSRESGRFRVKPANLAGRASTDTSTVSADGVVRLLLEESPDILLVDVREESAFRECSLPGAVHIPLGKLSAPEFREVLDSGSGKRIFYSNGDDASMAALTLAAGLGYRNCYRMAGGLNGWFDTVMNASFSGERISARENALLTSRFEAQRLFNRYNSLPDSLKPLIFAARQLERKKLDGGCE